MRGAWIEIFLMVIIYHKFLCRAPRGARGLKLLVNPQDYYQKVVAPREGRVD